MSVADRRDLVQTSKLCFNCLRPSHSVKSCPSKSSCKNEECKRRHHTLLSQHGDSEVAKTVQMQKPNVGPAPELLVSEVHSTNEVSSLKADVISADPSTTIAVLPRALIKIRGKNGSFQIARAMIDSCSGASLISEACMTRLGATRSNARLTVTGVAGTAAGTTKGMLHLEVATRFNNEVILTTEAYILDVLAAPTPSQSFDTKRTKFLEELLLADPGYNKPGEIDVILGVEVFLPILRVGQVLDEDGLPVAQNSAFGWLVAGRFAGVPAVHTHHTTLAVQQDVNIDQALRMFWETEEMPASNLLTADEKRAADLFSSSHKRNDDGRFIVRLPFDDTKPALDESLSAAIKRAMERRFLCKPSFKQSYTDFMREYRQLGHMELVPPSEVEKHPSQCFYLPHHAVEKEDSATTKLRVVFDASCSTSSGVSLNDRLLVGPNNTEDLFDVLTRFRSYQVVFVSDVEKMYRQVLVAKEDTDYQRIVWRDDPEQPIQHYRLITVTYGTSSAAYLATESLRQAAIDCANEYPLAADRIIKGFYVDDLMSGAETLEQAQALVTQISTILKNAGFVLRKWASNVPELMDSITDSRDGPIPLQLTNDTRSVKALGIHWSPSEDVFDFKVSFDVGSPNTKRQLLSNASKLFDPFGWLSPSIIKVKILFQQLWLHDLTWDDPLPAAIEEERKSVKENLHLLEELRIPRWVTNHSGKMQLIGFAETSEAAYAAVIYGRSVDQNGKVHVTIISAKTKVAPIQQVTLPRLELNAAVLLTTLMKLISNALSHLELEYFAYTDSTVVLEWLSSLPRKWKTYVANRTATILDFLPRKSWHHVSSKDNPADCASRGISPIELVQHELWWTGPAWLQKEHSFLEQSASVPANPQQNSEENRVVSFNTRIVPNSNLSVERYLMDRYSSARRVSRILATINRFLRNLMGTKDERETGSLTPEELQAAGLQLVRLAQHDAFSKELAWLRRGSELGRRSKLRPLHPFIDRDGMLRVGGGSKTQTFPST